MSETVGHALRTGPPGLWGRSTLLIVRGNEDAEEAEASALAIAERIYLGPERSSPYQDRLQ